MQNRLSHPSEYNVAVSQLGCKVLVNDISKIVDIQFIRCPLDVLNYGLTFKYLAIQNIYTCI